MKPTDKEIYEAYEALGSVRKVSRDLNLPRMAVWRAVRRFQGLPTDKGPTKKIGLQDETKGNKRTITSNNVQTLDQLLDAANVGDDWIVTRFKANAWQALGKDSEIMQLHQVTANLERANEFWVTPITTDKPIKRTPWKKERPSGCALIVPDTQHGFRVTEDMTKPGLRSWKPLHDRRAIDCVLKVAEQLADKITDVILLGDHLDLSPWSTRWPTTPDSLQTTNAAMRELYAGLLRPLRELLPHATIAYTIGNHENRIEDYLQNKAPEASTLRTADTVDGKPVLTLGSLLALDSLDIELIEPYNRPYWLFPETANPIKVIHGNLARNRGGATAAEYLKTATSSMIYGHIHRLELAQARIQTADGDKLITVGSPGCLTDCSMGVVPAKTGTSPDWQTGIGLAYEVDDGHSIQMIPIIDGVAVVEGNVVRGVDDIDAIRKATGIPF